MKKVCLFLIALFLTTGISHAYIESGQMVTKQFISNEGWSPEVYRIVRIKTVPEVAKQEYEQKKQKNLFVHYLKKGYIYLDPYADSEVFGMDHVDFRPKWDEI